MSKSSLIKMKGINVILNRKGESRLKEWCRVSRLFFCLKTWLRGHLISWLLVIIIIFFQGWKCDMGSVALLLERRGNEIVIMIGVHIISLFA